MCMSVHEYTVPFIAQWLEVCLCVILEGSVDAPLADMDMSGHGQQHIPVAKPCWDESH